MIPGVNIDLNGTVYTVPPMNFATLIKVAPLFKSFDSLGHGKLPTEEDFTNIVTIIHAAVKRNYPDVTFEQIAEGLDISNATQVIADIMTASGAVKSGEAKAGSQ